MFAPRPKEIAVRNLFHQQLKRPLGGAFRLQGVVFYYLIILGGGKNVLRGNKLLKRYDCAHCQQSADLSKIKDFRSNNSHMTNYNTKCGFYAEG
jgi:hypothetical protein